MRSVTLALLLCVPSLAAQDQPKPPTPKDRFEALLREYKAAEAEWEKSYNVESKVDWEARYRDWPAWAFAPRFLKLAEDTGSFDALLWIVELGRQVSENDRLLLPHYERALGLLVRDHLRDERMGLVCRNVARDLSPPAENFLRIVLEKGRDHEARGRACLGLAQYLAAKRQVALRPWFDAEAKSPFQQSLVERLDPGFFAYIRGSDPQALSDEAERLFERTIREYGDVSDPHDPGRTIADVAGSDLRELRYLSIGKVAPEIEGEDIDGRPMKLSDYRGKVVVLDFWGHW